jgi:hypothetical protein
MAAKDNKDAKDTKPASNAQASKKKNHTLRNVGLIILALIIIAGAYFYYEYLSGGLLTLVAAVASNPQSAQLLIQQKLNSYPQLSIGFSGTVSENVTTPQGDPVITLPFTINYQKYLSNTRTSVSFANFPVIGNFASTIITINNASTIYACYNAASGGYQCSVSNGTLAQIEMNLTNQFGLQNFGNVHISSASPSYYNGLPCVYVVGSGTLSGGSILTPGSQSSQVSFTSCFSSNYYVPLNLTAIIVPQTGSAITVLMHETNVSQSTSQAEVTTLPGPLQ